MRPLARTGTRSSSSVARSLSAPVDSARIVGHTRVEATGRHVGDNMLKILMALALGTLLAAPVYAQKPQIQWDKAYDFSKVKTFKWQPPSSPSLAESDPIMHRFIESAIEKELANVGFTETTGDPDIYVTYHGSTETEVQLRSTSFGYGVGSYGMGGWGMSGYGLGTSHTTTREVKTKKGSLVVDIVDSKEKQLVWRGTVDGILISDDQEKTENALSKAIEAMAKQNRKLRAKAGK